MKKLTEILNELEPLHTPKHKLFEKILEYKWGNDYGLNNFIEALSKSSRELSEEEMRDFTSDDKLQKLLWEIYTLIQHSDLFMIEIEDYESTTSFDITKYKHMYTTGLGYNNVRIILTSF